MENRGKREATIRLVRTEGSPEVTQPIIDAKKRREMETIWQLVDKDLNLIAKVNPVTQIVPLAAEVFEDFHRLFFDMAEKAREHAGISKEEWKAFVDTK